MSGIAHWDVKQMSFCYHRWFWSAAEKN